MPGASRKLAISHRAEHAAQGLLGDGDTELLENPLAKVDDPPAHDPMNRRNRSALQDRRQRRPMLALQPQRLPWRLAVDQAVRPMRVEPEHPVANDLKAHTADLGRLAAPRPVVDRRKRQQRFEAAPEAPDDPTPVEAMAHRLKTPAGRARYALRKQTPEPVFGIIKSALGFRQFSLRGLAGARGEWSLVTMAWNIKRLFACVPA